MTEEFSTVDLLLGSGAETRAVDAFALALIKAERQARKLVTHLVYQFPTFGPAAVTALRNTLAGNRNVYFVGFLAGFDALYPQPIHALVGNQHNRLRARLDEAIDHRNKIFHGQLTTRSLNRQDLTELASDIKSWCTLLAEGSNNELGYDGFGRNSFQKSDTEPLRATEEAVWYGS
ncbi:MAG: hypothetical protein ABI647_23245 [Gemmatimonadota bacterium]